MSQNSGQAITAGTVMVSLPIDTVRSSLHNSRLAPTVQQSNLSSLVHGGGAKPDDGFGVGGGTMAGGVVLLPDFDEGTEVALPDLVEEGDVVGDLVGDFVGEVVGGAVGEVVGELVGEGVGGYVLLDLEDGQSQELQSGDEFHWYQSSLPDQVAFPLVDGFHWYQSSLPDQVAFPLLPLLHAFQAPLLPLLPLLQAFHAPLLPLLPLLQAFQAPLLPLLPLLQAFHAPLLPLLPLLQAFQAPLLPLLPLLQAFEAPLFPLFPLFPEEPPQLCQSSVAPHDQSSEPHSRPLIVTSWPSLASRSKGHILNADGNLFLFN